VTVSHQRGQLVCTGIGDIDDEPMESLKTLSQALQEWDNSGQRYFQDLFYTDNGEIIARSLQDVRQ